MFTECVFHYTETALHNLCTVDSVYAVFSTARNCNRVLVGQDDSLSSVSLYTHVLYEGKDVRVYRIIDTIYYVYSQCACTYVH